LLGLDCDACLAGLRQIVDDKSQRKTTFSCWKVHYDLCACKDKTLEGQLIEGFSRCWWDRLVWGKCKSRI